MLRGDVLLPELSDLLNLYFEVRSVPELSLCVNALKGGVVRQELLEHDHSHPGIGVRVKQSVHDPFEERVGPLSD